MFAQRPGTISTEIILNPDNSYKTKNINSEKEKHFYGHGAFSHDGKLLYASENDTTNGAGKIGIYDATNKFKRLGEHESHGIGPHQISMMHDRHILAVCNGGIRTHPSSGRAKLNLEDMQSSLVFLDSRDGALIEKHLLAPELRQLSIRHMALKNDGNIIFGCQYQGNKEHLPPLLGNCQFGDSIKLWMIPTEILRQFKNYTGSVAISKNGEEVAISSPKGGIVAVFSTIDQKVIKQLSIRKACGLASSQNDFLASTLSGNIGLLNSGVTTNRIMSFDNHIGSPRL
jgi:hypothetical protein